MTRQGAVVAAMTGLSRVTGLLRDVVLAYLFGASQIADVFFVALRVPNFFRRMFAEGAFNQAFVPVMVRYREQGAGALREFLAPLLGIFVLVLIGVTALGVVFSNALAAVFAVGLLDDPAAFAQTSRLISITFPYLAFVSLVAYAGGVLNAHQRFALPSVTPVLLNLCMIGAALAYLTGWQPTDAAAMVAWGVTAAGLLAGGTGAIADPPGVDGAAAHQS